MNKENMTMQEETYCNSTHWFYLAWPR